MRVEISKQPPPAPTASTIGLCPTVIQIVGPTGTGSLPSTIAPGGGRVVKVQTTTTEPIASAVGPCHTIIQISRCPPALEVFPPPSQHMTNPLAPERPTYLNNSMARAYCACNWCGLGLFGHFFSRLFFLVSFFLRDPR